MDEPSTTRPVVEEITTKQRSARPELSITSFATPVDVLYANELMRGRLWVALCALFSIGGMEAALVFDGPGARARQVLFAVSLVMLVVSAVGLWILREDGRYSPRLAALYAYTCMLAVLPGFYFFGWFSPVVLLVALGGVFFAMGHSMRAVVAMTLVAVGVHAATGLLTIFGVLPSHGVSIVQATGTGRQLACLVICEGLIVIAFFVGRRLRAHALIGVERYGEVVRENARREALLEEAVEELKRVRKVGGPGRYTGLRLGSYELGPLIGRGGMAEVYDASHVETGDPAAVKVLAPPGPIDSRGLKRFQREMALTASLRSPHVVRVLEHSLPEASVLHLTMERLHGASLAEELRGVDRLPQEEIISMLRHVARGISAAHALGIIHRDLKPHNIFHHRFAEEDAWKILDFGVSTLAGATGTLTGNAVIGTPSYMSPEQALGQEIDQRTDLFSLASVAYRCLTGRPAFRGGGPIAEVLYSVVHKMPIQPSLLTHLPQEVDLVLAVALAKKPDQRFASAEELVDAVERALRAEIDPDLADRAARLLASSPWR